ncbi:unnamed protein product [Caretta caretta]
MEGAFGKLGHQMLIDTCATVSILCTDAEPKVKRHPIKDIKVLVGFNGREGMVFFTKPIRCVIHTIATKAVFGIQALGGQGIFGMDLLSQLNLVVALLNQRLIQNVENGQHVVIPASHHVVAVKAPEDLVMPDWKAEVAIVAQRHLEVFAKKKLQCGKITAEVVVDEPDPKP